MRLVIAIGFAEAPKQSQSALLVINV
jgi:hypothetical protein